MAEWSDAVGSDSGGSAATREGCGEFPAGPLDSSTGQPQPLAQGWEGKEEDGKKEGPGRETGAKFVRSQGESTMVENQDTSYDERVKWRVRELFGQVESQYRPQVLDALRKFSTNEQRLSYLRGWLKYGLSGRR